MKLDLPNKIINISGSEECSGVGGRILKLDTGDKTDMVFHLDTLKVLYILFGNIKLSVIKDGRITNVELVNNNSFSVARGTVYQLEAIEDSLIVEFVSAINNDDVFCISKSVPAVLSDKE
ncbi:MAG TPA: hypothetical protein VFV86_09020 [Nitrososphaeraceae archaeon]|nr:hypothetical protein [Nitrososphaeraceae archaeon]